MKRINVRHRQARTSTRHRTNLTRWWVLAVILLAGLSIGRPSVRAASPEQIAARAPVAEINNKKGLAVKGYDVVAYFTDGRPVKIVSIVDEHTRECPGGRVDRSPGMLVEELDRLSGQRGYRAVLRCDNGRELACAAMADQAGEGVGLAFIPPG